MACRLGGKTRSNLRTICGRNSLPRSPPPSSDGRQGAHHQKRAFLTDCDFAGITDTPRLLPEPTKTSLLLSLPDTRHQIFMGYFDTPEEAGRAYDMKLVELHGDDAGELAPSCCATSPVGTSRTAWCKRAQTRTDICSTHTRSHAINHVFVCRFSNGHHDSIGNVHLRAPRASTTAT
jgi:hypothetical protein